MAVLRVMADSIYEGHDDRALAKVLHDQLLDDPELIHAVMQIAGLTRNKILTDLRASTSAAGLRIPSSPPGLVGKPAVWREAGPYLAFRARKVLEPISSLDGEELDGALESINQATYPHWIRQERAKRQGHQAEYRVAILMAELGIPFEPREKADNPLCRDAQIHNISFDIVVPDLSNPVLCMKSTVQTSNIGQFGESKADLEVSEAVAMLERHFADDRPALLAMIDGVGFRSNTQGLHGVLSHADEFCQFESIWKAAAVAAGGLGEKLTIALPEGHEVEHQDFLDRYSHAVRIAPLNEEFRGGGDADQVVDAGEAAIRLGW